MLSRLYPNVCIQQRAGHSVNQMASRLEEQRRSRDKETGQAKKGGDIEEGGEDSI